MCTGHSFRKGEREKRAYKDSKIRRPESHPKRLGKLETMKRIETGGGIREDTNER